MLLYLPIPDAEDASMQHSAMLPRNVQHYHAGALLGGSKGRVAVLWVGMAAS